MVSTSGKCFSDNVGRNAIDGVWVFLRPVPRYTVLTRTSLSARGATIQALLAVTIHTAQGMTTPADVR
jgi:hypothetical protein